MSIKIVDREVNPLIATKWYLKKLIQELPLVKPRAEELKELNLPRDFIRRQSTDIIADCIRRVQCLYSWEKNSYTGIVYREECFNENINNALNSGHTLSSLNESIKKKSTIEHVIPVAHFKDKIFRLSEENKLKDSEIEIVKAFLSPVALIDKFHTQKDNENNVNKKYNNEEEYPFRRYINSRVKIITHDEVNVDNNTWSIEDHWNLLKRTTPFKDIFKEFNL